MNPLARFLTALMGSLCVSAAMVSPASAQTATTAATTMKTFGRDLPELPGVMVLDSVSLLLLANAPDSVVAYRADKVVALDATSPAQREFELSSMLTGTQYAVSGVAKNARELVLRRKADIRSHQLYMVSQPLNVRLSYERRGDAGRLLPTGEMKIDIGDMNGALLGGKWIRASRNADGTVYMCEQTQLRPGGMIETDKLFTTATGPAATNPDRTQGCVRFTNVTANRPTGFLLSDPSLIRPATDQLALGIVFSAAPATKRVAGNGHALGIRDAKAEYAVIWDVKTGKLLTPTKFQMASGAQAPGLLYTTPEQCEIEIHADSGASFDDAGGICGVKPRQ